MVRYLIDVFENIQDFFLLEPEQLGGILMEILPGIMQANQRVIFQAPDFNFSAQHADFHSLWRQQQDKVLVHVLESLYWLQTEGIIISRHDLGAAWWISTRRGNQIKTSLDLDVLRKARLLPRDLVTPYLYNRVRPLFLQGDYDTAVFKAFHEIEVSVRNAAKYGPDKIGVNLMRQAFHPETGPLSDMTTVPAEREALLSLYAGAIGYAKNPASHRHQGLGAERAAQLIIFASFLYERLIDAIKGTPP